MTATPPTFVAEYESAWNTTTTPKTVTPTIAPNDCLVIAGMTANDTTQVATPTDNLGTHLTYNLLQTIQVTDYCYLRLWTAIVAGGQSGSFTLSMARAGSADDWGLNCLRFSGVDAVGASNKANAEVSSGGQNFSFTTERENSVVVVFAADWTADSGTPTWRTVNGITPTSGNGLRVTFQAITSVYTVHGAYYTDAGAAGANAYGASVPIDQKYSIAAVELKGVVSGGGGASGFGPGFFDGI
jgi:hypothetical protein